MGEQLEFEPEVSADQPVEPEEEGRAKARFMELIERGEMIHAFIDRFAIYLGCEPWLALEQLEAKPEAMQRVVELHTKGKPKRKKPESHLYAFLYALEELIYLLKIHRGVEALFFRGEFVPGTGMLNTDWENDSLWKSTLASSSGFSDKSSADDADRNRMYANLTAEKLFPIVLFGEDAFDGARDLKHPCFARLDFWTMVKAMQPICDIETDRLHAPRVNPDPMIEKIGRLLMLELTKENGTYFRGQTTEMQERLRQQDGKDIGPIIDRYYKNFEEEVQVLQANERKRERCSASNAERRRANLLQLREVNVRLSSCLPVLQSLQGIRGCIGRLLSKDLRLRYKHWQERSLLLKSKRTALVNALLSGSSPVLQQTPPTRQQRKAGKRPPTQEEIITLLLREAESIVAKETDRILAEEGLADLK